MTAPEYSVSLPDSSVGTYAARMEYATSLNLHEVLDEVKKLQLDCEMYGHGKAICRKALDQRRSIQLSYGKILYNRDENIEVVYLAWNN